MPDEPIRQEAPNRFDRVFDSVAIRVIVSIGTFLNAAVLLGAKDIITATWPLGGHPWPGFGGQIIWVPAVYWIGSLLLLGTGICQLVAGFRKDKRTARNRNAENTGLKGEITELQKQSNKLNEHVETLPGGSNFRTQFAVRADALQLLVVTALLRDPKVTELEDAIRELLVSMAHLASDYGPSNGGLCSAYVMRFVESPTPQELNLVKMIPVGIKPEGYHGILIGEPELAATEDGNKVKLTQNFALGVLQAALVGTKASAVPGPQIIFADAEIGGMGDVRSLDKLKPYVEQGAVDAFETFTTSTPDAFGSSYVSLPLQVSVAKKKRQPIGVVTICSNKPDIMGGMTQRWKIYSMIMRPYADGVATLLKLLLEKRERK